MKQKDKTQGTGTRLTTAGRKPEWTGTPDQPGSVVNPPVWRASTHLYADTAALKEGGKTNADGRFYYGRRGAPTQWALAEALNVVDWEDLGFVCDGRFLFAQRSLEQTPLPESFRAFLPGSGS